MITVGWRELVGLPELGLKRVPAKIDSGARTSSLHGSVLEEFRRDGEKFVRFEVFHEEPVETPGLEPVGDPVLAHRERRRDEERQHGDQGATGVLNPPSGHRSPP